MGKRMFLQLFEDGGGAGSGGQGGNAGAGNGSQGNAGGSGNQGSYSFAQAEEIANARADRAEKAALLFSAAGNDRTAGESGNCRL